MADSSESTAAQTIAALRQAITKMDAAQCELWAIADLAESLSKLVEAGAARALISATLQTIATSIRETCNDINVEAEVVGCDWRSASATDYPLPGEPSCALMVPRVLH